MAFNDIKKTILNEAKINATKVIDDSKIQANQIESNWQDKISTRKKEIINIANNRIQQKICQAQFKTQIDMQDNILNKKNEIINQVFNSILEKLSTLSDNQYTALMQKYIEQLSDTQGVLMTNKNKKSLLEQAVKKSGKNISISNQTINSSGGFIFQSDKIDINYTFESLIDELKHQHALTVAQMLFNEKNK